MRQNASAIVFHRVHWRLALLDRVHRSVESRFFRGMKLPLLLVAQAAPDRIRPHRHRACVHLLLAVSALELPGGFALFKFSPSLCLSEPLPAVGRVRCCAFSAQKLHGAAVCNVVHDVSFLRFLADIVRPIDEKKRQRR
jgi:hypothetical protein